MQYLNVIKEPYRLLFPIGLIGACVGLGIWLPFLFGLSGFAYPGSSHALLQIQGYLLAFILGFLLTMLPKVLALPPWSAWSFYPIPTLLVLQTVALLIWGPGLAQILHGLLMAYVLILLGLRFPRRGQKPPPSFLLIAAALLADFAGTAFLLATQFRAESFTFFGASPVLLGYSLQYQAFPLLLILGVGSFLLPRFFLYERPHVPKPWFSSRLFWVSIALLIFTSCWLESATGLHRETLAMMRISYALRFGAIALVLFPVIGLHRVVWKIPPYLQGARFGLYGIALGLGLAMADPVHRLAWLHLVFIGGYGGLTLAVASRVVAGHGGVPALLVDSASWAWYWGPFFALGIILRLGADFWLSLRNPMLIAATLSMMLGFAVWAWRFTPYLGTTPAGLVPPQKPGTKALQEARKSG